MLTHTRRAAVVFAAFAVAGLVFSPVPLLAQQALSSKPIRFIIPFGPGGSDDTLARLLGQHLSERLGITVVPENRMGAGGKVRGLATTGVKRSHMLPDLPTVIEAGVPGFEVSTWLAIYARGGTPRPIVDRLHSEIAAILALPAVKDRLATLGYDIAAEGPDKLAVLMKSDTERWGAVIEKAGIPKID